jgi:hypothetical protein
VALNQDSGGTGADRIAEAERIMGMGLADHIDEMNDRERDFVEKMSSQLDVIDHTTFVSPKQLFWLRDLKDKYCI